ncbi:hypothetical protein, partial [Salmonella enterica]|uniref:hypothetical protein n=1 Tax=Salmonella enterica TaxID=28901 RepID=UPI0019D33DE0
YDYISHGKVDNDKRCDNKIVVFKYSQKAKSDLCLFQFIRLSDRVKYILRHLLPEMREAL